MVALVLWGDAFTDRKVTFRVDNMAVVDVVNRQSARDGHVLRLLRFFVHECLMRNIVFRAKHVPGLVNDIADALSRSQWKRFRGLAMGADKERTRMPPEIWQIGRAGFWHWS